jgi:hypothetical protein
VGRELEDNFFFFFFFINLIQQAANYLSNLHYVSFVNHLDSQKVVILVDEAMLLFEIGLLMIL